MIFLTIRMDERSRHIAVSTFPATIGRSAACQIVLDSESVSATHAVIEHVDGSYVIKDRNSTNGILVAGKRVAEHTVREGDVITLSDVTLDVHFTEVLDKTRIPIYVGDTGASSKLKVYSQHAYVIVGTWVFLVIVAAIHEYLNYWPVDRPIKIISEGTMSFVACAVTALVTMSIGKLTAKKFYYRKTLVVFAIGSAYAMFADFIHNTLGVNVTESVHSVIEPASVLFAIPFLAEAFHGPLARQRTRVRYGVAFGLIALVLVVSEIASMASQRPENTDRNPSLAVARPWSHSSPKAISIDALSQQFSKMKIDADDVKAEIVADEDASMKE